MSCDPCRDLRRRIHGATAPPIPCTRSPIPSGISPYARRQKNSRKLPFQTGKLMKPQLTTTLAEFSRLANRGNVIPVFAEFVSDGETPVSALKKLDRGGYNFLFESTEKNHQSGRVSFAGDQPHVVGHGYGYQIRV